jgi:hypothetical protein
MRLVEQWTAIEQALDPRWSDARVVLTIDEETHLRRALALLAPAGPGLAGNTIGFYTTRGGACVGPEATRRLLRRIDEEGIGGRLELASSEAAPPAPEIPRTSAAAAWDSALAALPGDWSDLLCELELTSSDHIERAALLIAPINPVQTVGDRPGFRFRCAHSFGYGAAPGMVRRCLARLDEEAISAEVGVLRALSDSHPVGTQGPVWYIGGRAV